MKKHYIVKKDRVKFSKLVFSIVTSDEEWASKIRRLVYNFN